MRQGARIAALVLRLAAASVVTLASGAASADDWDTVLAKARQEGTVVVHGAPGRTYNAALVGAFNKAHPDIKVLFSGSSGATEIAKVLRERQAGIYGWDVWVSGPTGAIGGAKEARFLAPLRPVLRPETTADDKWNGGFEFGWLDTEKKYFYAFDGTIQQPVMVNWDVVSRNDLATLADLLKPQFSGKIVWHDPRLAGTGNGTSQTLFHNLGEEALIALYKQKVVYTTNGHQMAEWIVRGRYPIAIGVQPSELVDFQTQGLGKNVGALPDDYYKEEQISVGFGNVGLVDRAPHINAATVYINWLLSKEGQEAWVKVPRNSRRTDVVPAFPELTPKKDRDYFVGQAEKFTEERLRLQRLAKQVIDGGPPRAGDTGTAR
jgi:iron(III) transport system substrate-binding protein